MSAFNGAGQFVISGVGLPYVTGTTISSTVANQLNQDIATGLSNCITRDGQSPPTANLPMGGFSWTGMGPATAVGMPLIYNQDNARLTKLGLGIAPINILDIKQDQNGAANAKIQNSDPGTAALAEWTVDNGTHAGAIVMYGVNVPAASDTKPDGLRIATNGAGGLTLATSGGGKPIYFAIDGSVFGQWEVFGLGIGGPPQHWQGAALGRTLTFGAGGAVGGSNATASINLYNNIVYDGANYVRLFNGAVTLFQMDGQFNWYTAPSAGAGTVASLQSKMRLFPSGCLSISNDDAFHFDVGVPGRIVLGASGGAGALYVYDGAGTGANPNNVVLSAASVSGCISQCATTGSIGHWRFQNPNGTVGMISTSGVSTTYATSSDETLKNFAVPQRDFKTILRAILVRDAEWLAHPGEFEMCISAQQTILAGFSDCVVPPDLTPDVLFGGVRNPHFAADYSKLAPLALWGVQDCYNEIDTIKARLLAAGIP